MVAWVECGGFAALNQKPLIFEIVSIIAGVEGGRQIMEISVRLGNGLAQHVGSSRLQVPLDDGATVADLIGRLSTEHPSLSQQLAACVAVVAGSHAGPNEPLSGVQEVALLLPISGG